MKIALVIQHGKIGGIEQHVLTLAKNLKEKKITPIIIMLFTSGPMVNLFKKEQIDCYVLNGINGHDIKLAINFVKIVRKLNPDLVHIHAVTLVSSICSFFLARTPIVITDHMAKVGKKIPLKTKIIYRIAHYRAKKIIAVSESTRQSIEDFNPVYRNKLIKLYNGITIYPKRVKESLSTQKNKNIILGAVGRLDIGKGWYEFLDVAKEITLKFPHCQFYVLGDGPLKQKLEEQTSKLGIAENVNFLGFRHDVREVLRQLSIYMIMSEYEACPLSLLEAMAEQVPIAGFLPIGGVSEINNNIYQLLEDRNIQTLTNNIIDMINGQVNLKKLTDKAYKRVYELFNEQNMTIQIISIYKEALNQ